MNEQLLTNLSMNETDVIASRRKFLTRMAYGSVLAMSGSGIVEAAAKHVIHTSKKADVKHAVKQHVETHGKNALHERLALKTAHNRHSDHLQLASKGNSSRIHSSLHKDHKGGHRLHHDAHERLALRDNNRIHHALHRDMPEFDSNEDFEPDFRSSIQDRYSLPSMARNGNPAHKTLSLQNTTTGDSLNVTYFEKGRYLPDALHEINHLYRDHMTDEIHPVDVALLDQLNDLQATLGIKKPIHVICGYRSPFTNSQLRRNSRGVARNSLHMQGRAIDIRISGVESRTIRDAALSMARGGVGYYPGSNFVHLDTGDVRTW